MAAGQRAGRGEPLDQVRRDDEISQAQRRKQHLAEAAGEYDLARAIQALQRGDGPARVAVLAVVVVLEHQRAGLASPDQDVLRRHRDTEAPGSSATWVTAASDRPRPAELPDAPLSLTLLDGSTFTLAAHAGRPIALTFVKTSCDTYMAQSRPAMAEACAAHARRVESLRRTAARVVWVTIAHPVWTSTQSLDAYRKAGPDLWPHRSRESATRGEHTDRPRRDVHVVSSLSRPRGPDDHPPR